MGEKSFAMGLNVIACKANKLGSRRSCTQFISTINGKNKGTTINGDTAAPPAVAIAAPLRLDSISSAFHHRYVRKVVKSTNDGKVRKVVRCVHLSNKNSDE